MASLTEILPQLPPELQNEVRDFAEFLLHKRQPRETTPPELRWRGALRHLRGQLTSVQLQHRALESWKP